jgi:hypothetical protein
VNVPSPAHSPKDPSFHNGDLLRRLRIATLIAVVVGAAGSVAFTLYVGRHSPPFLLVLFAGWVLLPFLALLVAGFASERWSALTRVALYCIALFITLSSLSVYGGFAIAAKPKTPVFVVTSPASLLLIVIVLAVAVWRSRRRATRGLSPPLR